MLSKSNFYQVNRIYTTINKKTDNRSFVYEQVLTKLVEQPHIGTAFIVHPHPGKRLIPFGFVLVLSSPIITHPIQK